MPRLRSRETQNYLVPGEDQNDSIKLEVDNKDLVCSRTELKSQSEYFNVMLSRYYKEDDGVITLKEIDGNTMQELLHLVHSNSYSVPCSELPGVIVLCDMFLFDGLKKKLICEARQRLSESNCLGIWMKLEILSLTPLIWKAKSLSLTTFEHQRDTGSINNLELPELLIYLGHPNLQCGSEINVFNSILDWTFMNKIRVSESILKDTLACINYRDISLRELSEMYKHPKISKHGNIVHILQYIGRFKCGEEVNKSNENLKIASAWYNSRGRYLPDYLFVFNNDVILDIFYHGHHENKFIRMVTRVVSKSFQGLTGGEVQVYQNKVYIFGGEFSMGKGSWNENFWRIDLNPKRLINTEYGILKRRHFKSCLVGDNLFIIGGTGPYRLKKNNICWFNFSTKTWSEEDIPLPCSAASIQLCNFNEKLFILDCPNRNGFIFEHYVTSWISVKISDSVQVLMEKCSSFSMFAFRGNLFFKGKKLLELELVGDMLTLKMRYDLPHHPNNILIDTVISNNRVYSMYNDQMNSYIILDYLDLNNLKSVYIEKVRLYYKADSDNENFETNEEIIKNSQVFKYNANKMIKMFFLHDYKYCNSEDLLVGEV